MKKIILASTSPRRQELLKETGLDFEVKSPSYDEKMSGLNFSYQEIEKIALNKAKSVAKIVSDSALIISADTVVVLADNVLGKPKDSANAIQMLNSLNGRTHRVVTSIAIIDTDSKQETVESTTSEVTFCDLTEKQIENYVSEFQPLDKAGSYGIQELPDGFVSNVKGDYDNIVGLPVQTLKKMLSSFTCEAK